MNKVEPQEIRAKIEEVLRRQKNLSASVQQVVRQKLAGLDWDSFVEDVLEQYYTSVESHEGELSSDECNSILMESIRRKIADVFTASD